MPRKGKKDYVSIHRDKTIKILLLAYRHPSLTSHATNWAYFKFMVISRVVFSPPSGFNPFRSTSFFSSARFLYFYSLHIELFSATKAKNRHLALCSYL